MKMNQLTTAAQQAKFLDIYYDICSAYYHAVKKHNKHIPFLRYIKEQKERAVKMKLVKIPEYVLIEIDEKAQEFLREDKNYV